MRDSAFQRCQLKIAAHGRGWLVAEKPHGMSVHNAPGRDLCSLLNRYLKRDPEAARAVAYDADFGLHPVHRLDKDTSGVILLSCQSDVLNDYARQFTQNKVTKDYQALVHGAVPPIHGWALWQWPLTQGAAGRRNPQGRGRRRQCQTQFRLMQFSRHYSLIECRLITGRTHQIRRHAALAGHPLVGDRRYGSLRACRYLEKTHGFTRLGLHAAALGITPPDLNAKQVIASAPLPRELEDLFRNDV